MAAAFSACGHRASTGTTAKADSVSTDSVKVEASVEEKSALLIDAINIERSESMAEVAISIQSPVKGNQELVKSIRQFILYICSIKDNSFKGDKKAFKDYVDSEYNGLVENWKGTYADSEDGGPSFTSSTTATKLAETAKFVTYYAESSSYTGGAHGMAVNIGKTFRKSDGKEIGYRTEYDNGSITASIKNNTLLNDTNSPKLYALIKDGVKQYFKENGQEMESEEDLKDFMLIDDINRIPLPGNTPYLTETGVVFCYMLYEIAPYAAGMITFEVPYEKISPLLPEEAQKLITE
jgi:hypothetical protein